LAVSLAYADALMVDGNGANIGLYTGILENKGSVVVSATGYRFVVERETGRIHGPVDTSSEVLYSENFNCTGTLYLDRTAQFRGVLVPIISGLNGIDLAALYYVPQTAAPVTVTLNGRVSGGPIGGTTCTAISPRESTVVPVLPNDPAVTGVPNSYFVPPLKVSRNDIFGNGFEALPLGAAEPAQGRPWQERAA